MTPLPSSPTPPDAPTPEEIAGLRELLELKSANITRAERAALASLLRAYEGMRATVEKLDHACANVMLTFDDWPQYEGSEVCRGERESALEGLREAMVEWRAARASAPDSEVRDG